MASLHDADIHLYISLFLLWLSSIFLLHFFFKKPTKIHLPPSPPALPLIGHLYLLSSQFFQSFQDISSKYGPFLYLRLGSFKCVLISSSSLAAQIFKEHDLTLSGKLNSPFGDSFLFGNSGFISTQYGDYWRFMKKLCVSELLSPKQIQRSRNIRREERVRFLRKILQKAEDKQSMVLIGELLKFTNNATCRMAMSTSYSEEYGAAEMCRGLVVDALDLAAKINLGNVLGPFKRITFLIYSNQFKSLVGKFDELLEKIMKEHEEEAKRSEGGEKENKDLMDILLKTHYDEKAEVTITRNHIKGFILDLFIAGTSSTADTTQWAMAELINHPNIFKKVREEIESVVGNRLVEESDVQNLPLLQAVVKETLRLHAPLPVIPRRSTHSFKVGDIDIPQDTILMINAHAMMTDPDLWDNPNEFCPQRFLDNLSELDNNKGLLAFKYLPFGMGRRICPGANLALISINTILACMIQCFDWKVNNGGEAAKVCMEIGKGGTTVRMAHPLQCVPEVHFNPFASTS